METKRKLPPLPSPLGEMVRERRLPQSLCLEGEPGSGRTALALALAGSILCQRQEGEMCGTCTPCQKVLAGSHRDVTLVEELPAEKQVDFVRELRASAYIGPHEGRAKVIILADAGRLSRDSQNILLKVLEEPPEDTCFILICDNKFRLLPTILSRVTTVALRPPGVDACARLLEERFPKKTREECREAALLAAGSPGEGERVLTHPQTAKRARGARELIRAMARNDTWAILAAGAPFETGNKSRQEYGLLLEAALRLVMLPEFLEEQALTPVAGAALRRRLLKAAERNDQNGYLPLVTALLAKKN